MWQFCKIAYITKQVFGKTRLPTKLNLRCRWMATAYTREVVPMARLPKMSRGKIRLAPLSQLFYFCPASISTLWRIYIQTYIHTSELETVYELRMPPNNTASETFLKKSGAVRRVAWIFNIGVPAWRWLGQYVTLGKTFYSLLCKQEVAAAPITATCSSLSHSSRRPLLETFCNIIIPLKINPYRTNVENRVSS